MLMFFFPFSLLNGLLVAARWFKNFSFKKGNEGSHSGYPFTKMKTECIVYICHKIVKKAKNNMILGTCMQYIWHGTWRKCNNPSSFNFNWSKGISLTSY